MTLPLQLQAARLKLAKERPYLASALWTLQPVEFKKGTMAVDMYWRLYYNPKYIDKLTIDEFSGALYHEICHLLRQHNQRMKNFPKNIANIAADIEVNNDLIDEGVTLPKGIITPRDFNLPEKLLAEEYANLLMQNKNQQQMQQQNQNFPLPGGGRCGSCATGQLEDWELPEGTGEQPGISESEAELIRRNVAVAIQQASMQRGDVPAHLKRWAEKKLKPKVNWRKELATAIKNTISNVAGCIDYSYSKPSRRPYKDIIMPSLRQPSISVAVVVDTSGSVSDNMLSQALAEIDGILKSVGLKNGVHYIACDAEVHVSKKITDIKQAELEGGGGTDMGVGIKAAMSLKPRPNVCIVLTDGYTPWPDTPPQKMKVIAGLLDKENETWQVPSWAKKVLIRAD